MAAGADSISAVLPCQKHLFSLPKGVVYLNCASRAPLLRSTEAVGHAAVSVKNEPWRIGGDGSPERLRELFAALVGATAEHVALTPSTSYALSQAAANILRGGFVGAGDAVVILEDQMSSNVYPWQWLCRKANAKLQVVRRPAAGSSWTEAVEETLAQLSAQGRRPAVLAVPQFLWTDGSGPLDLERLGALCRGQRQRPPPRGAHGDWPQRRTIFVVDVTQSLGVVPVDARRCQIDWLACSVHKWLFGPYGLSFCYVSEEWWSDAFGPLVQDEHSRAGADVADLAFEPARPGYEEAFQPGARRYDMGGRPNPILLPMVCSALEQVSQWQPDLIRKSVEQLMLRLVAGARRLRLSLPAQHAPHFVGVGPGAEDVPDGHRELCVRWADDAAAYLKARSVYVSPRFGVLRVAPHVYNDAADVDAFLRVLGDFVAERRQAPIDGAGRSAKL